MTALWIALALAAGYTAGHYRLPSRVFDRALDTATGTGPRGFRWAACVALVLLALAVHPRRTVRHMHSRKRPEPRLPAPQMDPHWGRR